MKKGTKKVTGKTTKKETKKVNKKRTPNKSKKLTTKKTTTKEYYSEGYSGIIEDETINKMPEGKLKELYKDLDRVNEEIKQIREENDADQRGYLANLLDKMYRIRAMIQDEKLKMQEELKK